VVTYQRREIFVDSPAREMLGRVPCPRFCVGMFRYHSKTKARRFNNMILDLVGRLNMPTLLRDVGMAPGTRSS